jgi:hypothetical protein
LFPLFATGINNTCENGGKLATGVMTSVASLPPMSLIPVVLLDLQLSPQIFEKI